MVSGGYRELLYGAEMAVFDLDGTIFDLEVDWDGLKSRINQVMSSTGHKGGPFTIRSAYWLTRDEPEVRERLLELQALFESRGMGEQKAVDAGYRAAKWRLDRGKRCCVFSMNTKGTLEDLLGDWGFEVMVAVDDVRTPKPDPEGLQKIMEELGLSSQEMVFVGNSERDSTAAERGGFIFVHVDDIDPGWFV